MNEHGTCNSLEVVAHAVSNAKIGFSKYNEIFIDCSQGAAGKCKFIPQEPNGSTPSKDATRYKNALNRVGVYSRDEVPPTLTLPSVHLAANDADQAAIVSKAIVGIRIIHKKSTIIIVIIIMETGPHNPLVTASSPLLEVILVFVFVLGVNAIFF